LFPSPTRFRSEADDLDVLAADLGAGHPIARLGAGGFAAIVRCQHRESPAQVVVVERSEVALAVRQYADLDRAARRGCVRRAAVARGQGQQRKQRNRGEQPPRADATLTSRQIDLLWNMSR